MEWKIYLADKTCYVFRDGELLDRFKIFKQQGEGLTVYNRWNADKNDTPSIEKMKLIASTTGEILYDRKKGLHFQGLAKKVDDAGGMAYVAQLSPEIVKSYKSIAKLCLEQAKTCLNVGGPFKENALMVLKEIDKYDPDNEEYQALLKSISE